MAAVEAIYRSAREGVPHFPQNVNIAAILSLGGIGPDRTRLEIVAEHKGGLAVVDYAHKPEALGFALEALRPFASGRLVVVFGAGGDRDPGKRPLMGRAVAELADAAIVTDDNPRSEDPDATWFRVVGVVPDLFEGVGAFGGGEQLAEMVYLPLGQADPRFLSIAARAALRMIGAARLLPTNATDGRAPRRTRSAAISGPDSTPMSWRGNCSSCGFSGVMR